MIETPDSTTFDSVNGNEYLIIGRDSMFSLPEVAVSNCSNYKKMLIFFLILSLLLTLKTFVDKFNLFANFQNF